MCEIMRSAAASLGYDGKLRDDRPVKVRTMGCQMTNHVLLPVEVPLEVGAAVSRVP